MESILSSTKKLLGLEEEITDFDNDIIMYINSAIFTLRQLGVVNKNFAIASKEETYKDLLGEDSEEISEVKVYIYYKVKIAFDPPQSSIVMSTIKEMIRESEWRLKEQSASDDIFSLKEGETK